MTIDNCTIREQSHINQQVVDAFLEISNEYKTEPEATWFIMTYPTRDVTCYRDRRTDELVADYVALDILNSQLSRLKSQLTE